MNNRLYDRVADTYASLRVPDPRIAARVHAAIGSAMTLVNVGAGTGSYEPLGRTRIAVDASLEMLKQRSPDQAPAVQCMAQCLPFQDATFDASLAILTLHHWRDPAAGLAEMRRVARHRVVVLTWDPAHTGFWLVQHYFPEILSIDRQIFPTLEQFEAALGPVDVIPVTIPADCTDGFLGAYWKRPWSYLDARVRAAISTFDKIAPADGLAHLRRDLTDGTWARNNAWLADSAELDLGYRLVVAKYP
ncbi:MAG: class I SAM-dependent methyltransferase [Pseudomonadota bacterium]